MTLWISHFCSRLWARWDQLVFSKAEEGCGKRDPSRYLFIIAIEALSCLLSKVVETGFLTACKMSGR